MPLPAGFKARGGALWLNVVKVAPRRAIVLGQHPDQAFDFAVAHREQVDSKIDSTSRSRFAQTVGGRTMPS